MKGQCRAPRGRKGRAMQWLPLVVICFLAGRSSAEQESPARALEAAGVRGGLIVHVGCGDGRKTVELTTDEKFVVHGLDVDKSKIEAARKAALADGRHGRISFSHLPGNELPYSDNLVNLLIAEEPGEVDREEMLRVLTPLGVLMLKEKRQWARTVKPWPEEMDQWTHWRHDADGNMVSEDTLVGPPRYVKWMVGPMWQRHHGMIPSYLNMVSASGRLFYIRDEAVMGVSGIPGVWRLVARDAFNGKLLWKRAVPDWGPSTWSYFTESHVSRFNHPINIRERMVAAGDRVYVTLGFNAPLCAIDAATGEVLNTFEGTDCTDETVLHGGTLYLSVNERPLKPMPGEGTSPFPTTRTQSPRKKVLAIDPEDGKKKWESELLPGACAGLGRMKSMGHLNLTVSDQGVFVIDEKDVVCLEPADGTVRWRTPRLFFPEVRDNPPLTYMYHCYHNANLQAMMCHNGLVFIQQPKRDESSFGYNGSTLLQALSPETGREVWRYDCGPSGYLDRPDVFGVGDLIWVVSEGEARSPSQYVGLNAETGKVERTLPVDKVFKNVFHHHRCYPDKATQEYLIFSRRGAEFASLDGNEISINHWARSGCRIGPLPANGLFYRGPDHCACYTAFQPRGFYAFASERSVGVYRERLTDRNPLEKEPAFATPQGKPAANASDWPTFRHDPERSGATGASVPAKLEVAWKKKLGSNVSAPVVAGGAVYLSIVDENTVVAIDAATGDRKWMRAACGKVDSPPTLCGSLVLFGTRTGWVCCLRASDGEPAWRFRAAPGDRLIMASERLESPLPVNGSVLVRNGKVVFTAGHSSLLDGGMYLYVLDAGTGELLEKKKFSEEQVKVGRKPNPRDYGVKGAFSDILTWTKGGFASRSSVLDVSTLIDSEQDGPRFQPVTSQTGFFDSQWFNRTKWSGGGASGHIISCDADSAYYAVAHINNCTSFFIPEGASCDGVVDARGPSWLRANVKHGVTLGRKTKGKSGNWKDDELGVCPWAMVAASKHLFVAGFTLKIDKDDPWAAFEGRKGGVLAVLDKESGERLAEYELDSPPVWNGIAAVEGLLFLSCRDGSLVCFESKERSER